jgi:hypothetical protein
MATDFSDTNAGGIELNSGTLLSGSLATRLCCTSRMGQQTLVQGVKLFFALIHVE